MKRLVIDTETGGLRPREHSLLTIGMVLVDFTPKRIEFIDEKHIFLKHEVYHVGRTAMRINGINLEEHHAKGVLPKFAFKEMDAFMGTHDLFNTMILGHNVHFDINFLKVFFDSLGEDFLFSKDKEDTRYMWERLRRQGLVHPFKDAKLGTIANHFGIDYSGAHDAINDCKITAQVYRGMLGMQNI